MLGFPANFGVLQHLHKISGETKWNSTHSWQATEHAKKSFERRSFKASIHRS